MITESLCHRTGWKGSWSCITSFQPHCCGQRQLSLDQVAQHLMDTRWCLGFFQTSNLRCVFWGLCHCCSGLCQQERVGRDNSSIYPRYPANVPCWLEQKPVLKKTTTLPSCKMFPVSFGRCQGRLAPCC